MEKRETVVLDPFEEGLLVGILVGEGSFTGDGRHPHVALRMHVRHEAIFNWLAARFPRSRIYGPYEHSGRRYLQWMARGPALVLDLMPILDRCLTPEIDAHAYERYHAMTERYADRIARIRQQADAV